MIKRGEIESKASAFEIHTSNVQRDYVFGWLLFGLFTISSLKDRIFLKGGNALRKGYFENTRFSGDLDFGTPGEIPSEELLSEFSKIAEFIQTQSGVEFCPGQHFIREKFPASESPVMDLKVFEVRLYFRDFYGNADHIILKIAIDFTRYDKVALPPQMRNLIHPYSDSATVACSIRCMKIEEIVATKLKCLLQRQHAPDLFDYVHSVRLLGGSLNRTELVTTFLRKTIFGRNPNVAKELLVNSPFDFFRKYWENGIVCAKNIRIGVEEAVKFLVDDLSDLFKTFPAAGSFSRVYFSAEQRLPIMEAGREMTCLRIVYDGVERVVEPYALKFMQRRDGLEREYFYVFDRSGGRHSGPGIKSLVSEKLTRIENTAERFEPQFLVELAKQGELPKDHYLFDPNRPAKSSSGHSSRHYGPRYIYQCTYCGRRFERGSMNSNLRSHKNKSGSRDCPGRTAFYVNTKS